MKGQITEIATLLSVARKDRLNERTNKDKKQKSPPKGGLKEIKFAQN